VSTSSSGHGHARVVIGFILTGLAFVVAGRRSIRNTASPAPPYRHRYEPQPSIPPLKARVTVPDLPRTTPVATFGTVRSTAPSSLLDGGEPGTCLSTPVATVTESAGAETHVTNGATRDAFDSVMARVTTLLDKATSQLDMDDRILSRVGIKSIPGGGSETPDPFPAPDVASGATLLLARNSARSRPAPTAPAPPPVLAPAPTRAPVDSVAVALRRVGLDESLVVPVVAGLHAGGRLEALLLEAFADLVAAPPPPRRPGSLLVVVGDGVPARRLGAALADEIGIDPAEVPFASRHVDAHTVATGALLVRSAEEAAERAPGWRRSHAAVVVVDASMTSTDRSWATHMINTLRPTAVWGVVDATAKTEDIRAWTDSLGGVDALALEHIDATVSPAAVFGAGHPVARIDGQPTSAARWVATVVDRITRLGGAPDSSCGDVFK
jgi:hypothetical protein